MLVQLIRCASSSVALSWAEQSKVNMVELLKLVDVVKLAKNYINDAICNDACSLPLNGPVTETIQPLTPLHCFCPSWMHFSNKSACKLRSWDKRRRRWKRAMPRLKSINIKTSAWYLYYTQATATYCLICLTDILEHLSCLRLPVTFIWKNSGSRQAQFSKNHLPASHVPLKPGGF